jgi:Bacterial PH domain
VTAQIQIRYLDPEQDAVALQTIAREAARIMVPGEEILCIAAENRTSMSIKRDSVVVTTRRIIGISPGLPGRVSFRSHLWPDVLDVSMNEGILSSQIVVETYAGAREVGWIPKEQANLLYGIARRMERDWREKRHIMERREQQGS